jgi:hypothetical protein
MMRRQLILLALLAAGEAGAAGMSCHIHLPENHPQSLGRPTLIPDVGDRTACEQLNRELYGGQGTCHCSFGGFGPKRPLPGDSPIPNGLGPQALP